MYCQDSQIGKTRVNKYNNTSKKIPKTLKRKSNELQDSVVKENKNDFSKMTKPELIEEAEKLNLKFVKKIAKIKILKNRDFNKFS